MRINVLNCWNTSDIRIDDHTYHKINDSNEKCLNEQAVNRIIVWREKEITSTSKCYLTCASCIFIFNSVHMVARVKLRCASHTSSADPVGQDLAINYSSILSFSFAVTNKYLLLPKPTKLIQKRQTNIFI